MNQVMTYKDLEWYIIHDSDKEKLLFLKDCFTNEQVLKYFTDKSMVDLECDVRFSKMRSPWFRDSYIREVLNTAFLAELNKEDLNPMETTVTLDGEFVTTTDYVRLITKKEVEQLPIEILKTERKYGYWTMSPYHFSGSSAYVFVVRGSTGPGYLGNNVVSNSYGVRPLVSLKSENQKARLAEIKELIKIIYILNNNKVNSSSWNKYYFRYMSLISSNDMAELVVLRGVLAESLLNARLSSISVSELDKQNEYRKSIENSLNLGNSKKLIIS